MGLATRTASRTSRPVRDERVGLSRKAPTPRAFELAGAVVAAAGGLALAVPLLRLWKADLRVPFAYTGDVSFNLMLVKGIVDHGWYERNPSLGAPFGQELYDFPHNTDNLNFLIIKLLSLVTSDAPLVLNLFFLLGFPLVALSAFLVMRQFRVSVGAAVVTSLLFTLLPYHFIRGEQHVFLAAYYAVPVGAFLVLSVLEGRSLFALRDTRAPPVLRYASRRTLLTLGLCVLVGSAGLYYAAFTIVLVTVAGVIRLLARSNLRAAAVGAAVACAIGLTLLANAAPSLVYRAQHGANPLAVARHPSEGEIFSLKLPELLLPIDQHRIELLARVKQKYTILTSFQIRSETFPQSLGIVGSAGFLWLIVVAVASGVGRPGARVASRCRPAAAAAIVAVLVSVTSGFGTFVSFFVSPLLHAWGRMSVFIGFLSLLAIAMLLDATRSRFLATRPAAVLWPALLGVVLVVGVLDQTSDAFVPPYAPVAAEFESDAAFVDEIEQELPDGAAIYQLPYMPFPVGGDRQQARDYDLLRGFAHSSSLRWSYGAMKGRPADWAAEFASAPPRIVAPALAAGFDGIYVDRLGYADHAVTLERELGRVLRAAPRVSASGRLLFFDLRPYAGRLRQRYPAGELAAVYESAVKPVVVDEVVGFSVREQDDEHEWRWATSPTASLELENPSKGRRLVRFVTTITTATGKPASIRVDYPDGVTQSVTVPPAGTRLAHALRLPPGQTSIRFATRASATTGLGGDPRSLYFRLADTRVLDPRLEKIVAGA